MHKAAEREKATVVEMGESDITLEYLGVAA
jgi:hypothetical protein